jgi:hypothetical protein
MTGASGDLGGSVCLLEFVAKAPETTLPNDFLNERFFTGE